MGTDSAKPRMRYRPQHREGEVADSVEKQILVDWPPVPVELQRGLALPSSLMADSICSQSRSGGSSTGKSWRAASAMVSRS